MATTRRSVRGKNFAERMAHELKRGGEGPMILLEYAKDEAFEERDSYGRTALLLASVRGRKDVVQALLERGVDAKQESVAGRTALHEAAAAGHADVCAFLFDRGVSPTKAAQDGKTPLHDAAIAGHVDVVRWLLAVPSEPRVAVDALDRWESTALLYACRAGKLDVVQCLLDGGADPSRNGQYLQSPALAAASNETRQALVALLLSKQPTVTPALLASLARFGWLDLVRAELANEERRAAYAAQPAACQQALASACSSGKQELVELVLERLPSVSLEGEFGWQCLTAATTAGQSAMVSWLFERGVTISEEARTRSWILYQPVVRKQWDCVRLLLEKGMQVLGQNWAPALFEDAPEDLAARLRVLAAV